MILNTLERVEIARLYKVRENQCVNQLSRDLERKREEKERLEKAPGRIKNRSIKTLSNLSLLHINFIST